MKKASDILMLISGVISILWAVGYLISAIVFFVLCSPQATEFIVNGLKDGTIHSTLPGTPEEIAAALQIVFLTIAVIMVVALAFAITCAVFSFTTKNSRSTIGYILVLVFGVLSGTFVGTVGGILGLVSKDE